jgi:TrkA-N domain
LSAQVDALAPPARAGPRTDVVSVGLAMAFAGLAVVSFLLGYLGLQEYLPALNRYLDGLHQPVYGNRPLDLVYYDVQLFLISSPPVSNGHPAYPWPLEIARFGAPASFAYALLATLRFLLDTQLRQLRARLARGHSVVCGGGPAGLALGRALRRSGHRVVIVDDGTPPAAARGAGLLHVAGDSRDELALRRAGTGRAHEAFVLHADSSATVATVLAIARLAHPRRPRTCYAAIADREVYAGLQARHIALPDPRRLQLHLVNLSELAAQAVLEVEPPPLGPEPAHVVVVGLGDLGESLVVELARRRQASSPGSGQPLLVTAAAPGADAAVRRLRRHAPFLARSCVIEPFTLPPGESDSAELSELLAADPPPDRVYVCCDDDAVALRVGLRALWSTHRHRVRVVVCVERGAAFTAAFHLEERLFDDAQGSLRVLALLDLVLVPERIRSSLGIEQLARALHASYLEGCVTRGETPGTRPALIPWDDLPEDLRESNRNQARHIGEKLAAIGCVLVPRFDATLEFAYRGEHEVMALARLEHERWMRERRGIAPAQRPFRDGRDHPDLVDWELLPQPARDKDAQFVRDLPQVLADAGFQVVRLPRQEVLP